MAVARRPAGHGMVLLQYRGTPAWLGAWSQLQPMPAAPAPAATAGPATEGAREEIALVLTTMALSAAGR